VASSDCRSRRSVSHLCYDAYTHSNTAAKSRPHGEFNNHQITVVKDNGLVSHVFAETTLRALAGDFVIGHTRYSTVGLGQLDRGPAGLSLGRHVGFAIAHNGNLTNTTHSPKRRNPVHVDALGFRTSSPNYSRARSSRASHSPRRSVVVLARTEGAYSMVVLEAGEIHAVRDPTAFGRCVLDASGAKGARGWIVASESRVGCRGRDVRS